LVPSFLVCFFFSWSLFTSVDEGIESLAQGVVAPACTRAVVKEVKVTSSCQQVHLVARLNKLIGQSHR